MKKRLVLLMGVLVAALAVHAQELFPVNGTQDARPELYAFTHVNLHVDYQTALEDATLVIREGKIEAAGKGVAIPAGAVVYDLTGYEIYPSFVEVYSSYGVPEPKSGDWNWGSPPQLESKTEGAYNWNQAIRSQFRAVENFSVNGKAASALRGVGFGTVLSHQMDGISRGSGTLVTLGETRPHKQILVEDAAHILSFSKGTSRQQYPSSLMGSIALLRQTYADAAWYGSQSTPPFQELSLEAWNRWSTLPQIFAVDSKLEILRADNIGDEFGVRYIVRGNGDEYQRIREIKAANVDLLIPLEFPDSYDVADPLDARVISLAEMKHWEMAPSNAAMVAKEGINFAFTLDGLSKKTEFLNRIRKAMTYGLTQEDALKALTYTPAKMLGAEGMVGSLKQGMLANFLITDGNLFEEGTSMYQNWVRGERFELKPMNTADYAATLQLEIDGGAMATLKVVGDPGAQAIKLVVNDSTDKDVKGSLDHGKISFTLTLGEDDDEKTYRLSGYQSGDFWEGQGTTENGTWVNWRASIAAMDTEGSSSEGDSEDEAGVPEMGSMIYPFVAYGRSELPSAETMLIKNATVWTLSGDEPVLENTDVLVRDGKIAQVGQNLSARGAKEVDGEGMHLTPGIVDEHSHIAISRGVNEGTHAVTAEVRIGDVVNSEDVNIYRQLAGGVTTSQLLHGSANPIGGQSAIIKLRWGLAPEQMKFAGADGFIKCALGENVKQSNWGDNNTIRFPQTRMGVEQVFVNAFTEARHYEEQWKAYNALSSRQRAGVTPPRRDIQMETLVEILNSKRFITCHSYVQSEINMLMHVAERFDFRINTFTHILEGYKLADKMVDHGVGGSTFADWWAYKMEVREAIPYNASLMNGAGVVTAINSDDAEMARRLNQEAAKGVKYGGMSEVDALKMVTLNPAKLLHLDDQIGTIEVGKDADLVLWTDHPLSIYARPSKTIIDGVVYFDLEEDAQLRMDIAQERARLINKMLGGGGNGTNRPKGQPSRGWECEDIVDVWSDSMNTSMEE